MPLDTTPAFALPQDAGEATLVGRVFRPDLDGPSVVVLRGDAVIDITADVMTMRDLIARTSLITAVYRNTNRCFNCGSDEHAEIVEAILAKNVSRAVSLMAHHLEHVESELDLQEINDFSHDLRAALA